MRIIPVMDLMNGLAVHAIGGERALYQPVNSSYSRDGDPLSLACSFRDRLGCAELYVADLDAIQKQGQNREIIAEIAVQTGLRILLDAGIAAAGGVREMLACGASKVIIGSETLQGWSALGEIQQAIPSERLVFSLDMRSGQVLSASPDLAGIAPLALLQKLSDAGWRRGHPSRPGPGGCPDRSGVAADRRGPAPLPASPANRRWRGTRRPRPSLSWTIAALPACCSPPPCTMGAITPGDIRRLTSGSAGKFSGETAG